MKGKIVKSESERQIKQKNSNGVDGKWSVKRGGVINGKKEIGNMMKRKRERHWGEEKVRKIKENDNKI